MDVLPSIGTLRKIMISALFFLVFIWRDGSWLNNLSNATRFELINSTMTNHSVMEFYYLTSTPMHQYSIILLFDSGDVIFILTTICYWHIQQFDDEEF